MAQINHTNDRTALDEHKSVHKGNIARDGGKPKAHAPTAVHSGMTSRQKAGASFGGIAHPYAGAPDASSSNPLDPTVLGKRLAPVATSFGMKNRTRPGLSDRDARDLGMLVLSGAKHNGGVK